MRPPAAYPSAHRDATFDVFHGTRVDDPYRWLEDPESPETITWTDAQNALTRRFLDGSLRDRLRTELLRLYDYPRSSAPVQRRGRYFFARNAGLQNQPVLYVQDGVCADARALLDPNALSQDGTIALTAWEPSPNGCLLAYALSRGGSDRQDVRVRDVESGVDLPDHLLWAKFVSIAWNGASDGFYYPRFPERGTVPEGEEQYRPAVYYHRVGEPQSNDARVFGPVDDPEVVYDVDISSDYRWLAITALKGASERSAIIIMQDGTGDAESRRVRWQVDGFDDNWSFIDAHGGDVFVRTTRDAPRGRVLRVDTHGALHEVIAESGDRLVDARLVGGRLALLYLHHASSRLVLVGLDGTPEEPVPLPAIGSVTELTGEADDDELFVRFASFTWPPAVLRYALRERVLATFAAPGGHITPDDYIVCQEWYPSRDGTPVSMFLVQRRDLPRDGARPVWMTGYGGFNVNVVPDFDPAHFVWLNRGGLVAVPNLRGGGEYGEAWHEAGMLGRKQNVFDDLIAGAEWLVAQGYTRPRRIVVEGGSNGGLLVAAALIQRPDLWGAVVCRVPVADMLRYHRFTVGRFWIPEYGVADNPAQFEWLYRYSPLHGVRDGIPYPPVLITTAETDDRVDPGMARKLAARLQEAVGAGAGPILIRIEKRAGHGAGKPVWKVVDEEADIYAFALAALDLQ
ncbi:MAG TPA: prolyl oligopeptidase family serine peptidase [Vicinamibacterales bacterium]|nr:prolyl oligopeptidase family serine peptidase [Vicinamibacterales bacterium]